jgi:hypothetical protein
MKSKGKATKKVISAIRSHFVSCSLREASQETLTGEKHQGSSSAAPIARRMGQRFLVVEYRAEIAHIKMQYPL